MIRRLIVAASILSAFSVLPANAGTVSGKIRLGNVSSTGTGQTAGEKENVVIWLEGQEQGKPPEAALKISQKKPAILTRLSGGRKRPEGRHAE